jgi:heat shock protein HslJ
MTSVIVPAVKIRGLVALAGLLAVVGCGGDDDGGAAAGGPSFEDVPWTHADGPSATFSDGTVSGSTGCNRFSATYTTDGDALEIGQVATTNAACPDDTAEREFLAALDRVEAWRVEGGELALDDGDGNELLRLSEPSPVGSWEATMFRQGDGVSSPLPDTRVTAEFGEDGTLSGSAGCNSYSATYEADRGTITIGEPAATRKACVKPAGVMEQEQAYLDALPQATGYRVEGATLSLLTPEGTYVAIYQRP